MTTAATTREWLEADGLGGFASGPVAGPRTRRYHALLLTMVGPRRFVLVNGLEASITTPAGTWRLGVESFEGARAPLNEAPFLESFESEPWPTWIFRLPDGTRLAHELFAVHGEPTTALGWRLLGVGGETSIDARPAVTLRVRPFLSGRDYHALHHENPDFAFGASLVGHVPNGSLGRNHSGAVAFRPYRGAPAIYLVSNGSYGDEPQWYRQFHYADEAARGLPATEDLAAPGVFSFQLDRADAQLVLATEAPRAFEALRQQERLRRQAFTTPLHRAADAYVVSRPGGGRTIIAGYPWFTDWGRDTFISLRGLCLAAGALDDARAILLRWADVVSGGMLPNRFPDDEGAPEYNAIDAALWFVVATYELLQAPDAPLDQSDRTRLRDAIERILLGYAAGTRYRIRLDADGLLAGGEPGVQLTWMDAKIGDWVVTPRVGKPVEVQALWLNALRIGEELGLPLAARWRQLFALGKQSFMARFWNAERGCLYDVVDDRHEPGRVDPALRPNQIFAVGGLPFALLEGPEAHAVVDVVEGALLTSFGLRTLGPHEPSYCPRYRGDLRSRDGAYHQGTVWPWLLGPFVEAWLRVRGSSAAAKEEARRRFLLPLRAHLGESGVGHLAEVADGEPPQTPGGCPFQAWSLGELLRLTALLSDAKPMGHAVTVHESQPRA